MHRHYLPGAGAFAAVFLVHTMYSGLLAGQPVEPAVLAAANVSSAGYPFAGAACEFGRSGGPECANPRNPADAYDWGYWRNARFRASDPWGYEYRNCTSYVAWRLARSGVPESLFAELGDASDWIGNVRGEPGVAVNHTPSPGAIAAWNFAGVGHVAWVVFVRGSRVTVADYNYAGTGAFDQHVFDQHSIGSRPTGYIHFPRR